MPDTVRDQPTTRVRSAIVWTLAVTLIVEAITVYLRFRAGIDAVAFNAKSPPLLLKIHHMFWSVPLLLILPLIWRFPRTSAAILGIACGLIVSDLIHHFLVLPLTVGNIGWHWP